MTYFRDPPRLRVLAESESDPLAEAIEEFSREEPSSAQLGAVAARTRLLLGLPSSGGPPSAPLDPATTGTPPVGAPIAGMKGALAIQWIANVVIPMGIGALGAVAVETARAPTPVPPAAPSTIVAPAVERAHLEPETRPVESATPPTSALLREGNTTDYAPNAPSRAPAASSGRATKSNGRQEPAVSEPVATPDAPDAPRSSATEISIVTSAHRAVTSDPRLALELTREHENRFPFGALAQEREVIAIQALLRLERRSEAEARAARFHAQFPGSAHGRRIDVLLSEDVMRR